MPAFFHKQSCIVLLLIALAVPGTAKEPPHRPITSRQGMVVSVSVPASQVGATILRRGGNAVDAAVATAFALAVTHPPAGNIGGGGFMMIVPTKGATPVCIDYRETAPAAATETMFALGESNLGAKAVGVPGTVRGLALAHKQYGQVEWKTLLQPAIKLATDGFTVDPALAKSLNAIVRDEKSQPFAELRRVFGAPNDAGWKAGDRLVQPELATTLRRIAAEGPRGFYHGPVANAIVAEMRASGGIISLDDLANYRAKTRVPIHGTFRGYDVYGPPPPSSGGIALMEMLNVLETFNLRSLGRESPEANHLLIETMRRAFLDRARYLGDQDYVTVPAKLTTKSYARQLASQINPVRATPSETLASDIPLAPEGTSTTHFSVVDAHGMAVSNTYTLEQSYGARVVVRGCGFLLNNEMGDFNWVPGHTDHKGRIGTRPNLIAPGKRMLSSQTPVIVLKDGQLYLIAGSPGGRTIINTVLCVLLNVLEYQMDLPEAIRAPRWHHQWLPDVTRFEGATAPNQKQLVAELQAMGHHFNSKRHGQGDAHCILIDPKTGIMTGVADHRIRGKAVAAEQSVAPRER